MAMQQNEQIHNGFPAGKKIEILKGKKEKPVPSSFGKVDHSKRPNTGKFSQKGFKELT